MNRRSFLFGTGATLTMSGCVAPSEKMTPTQVSGVYDASPNSPNCPVYNGEEVTGYRWGQIIRNERTLSGESIRTSERALEWAKEEYGRGSLVTGVDTIQWKGSNIDIPSTYDTSVWFLVAVEEKSFTVLIIPREDSTTVVEYVVGDC